MPKNMVQSIVNFTTWRINMITIIIAAVTFVAAIPNMVLLEVLAIRADQYNQDI